MIQYTDIRTVDLADGLLRENGIPVFAASDSRAHVIGARIVLNGEAVSLAGYICKGYFIRPDGATLTLEGTVDGNAASVTLSKDAYLYDGAFSLALTLEGDGGIITARIIAGRIIATSTEIIGEGGTYSLAELMDMINARLPRPAQEGQPGFVLTTDGAGGVSWQDISAGNIAGTVLVDSAPYTLRTGSTGAAGYMTIVPEA